MQWGHATYLKATTLCAFKNRESVLKYDIEEKITSQITRSWRNNTLRYQIKIILFIALIMYMIVFLSPMVVSIVGSRRMFTNALSIGISNAK